jgi:hypothetical protein
MARSHSPQDLISIPNLTADESVTLGTSLLTRRTKVAAPEATNVSADELRDAVLVLKDELLRMRTLPVVSADVAKTIDRRLDVIWAAFRDWLSGWLRCAKCPSREEATALYQALFGEGLEWVNARYAAEWAASETRVDVIQKSAANTALIRTTLGGGPILDELFEAHAAYTEMTTAKEPGAVAENPKVGEAMREVHASMREYVSAVVGTQRRRAPATIAIVDALLEPLSQWESRKTGGGSAA